MIDPSSLYHPMGFISFREIREMKIFVVMRPKVCETYISNTANKKFIKNELNIYCRSRLHIDYLQNPSLEIHALRVIELTIEYPYVVVLIS